MRKRYLFFDIDGTLLAGGYEHGYVPDSAREALRRLRENGHFLAIATGRSNAMARPIMDALGFENMVSDGGFGLTVDGRLLGIRPLCGEDVAALVRECGEKGLPWGLQLDDSDVRCVPDGRFLEATGDTYLQTRVVPGLRPESCGPIYKAYVACRYPAELGLETLKRLPWCRYHDSYFFVEPTDKGAGIRALLARFGAEERDAVVFGDSENDLSMFDGGWLKVAMGNAVPALKAKADYVTSAVDRDGIYKACAALGLI